VKLVEERRLPRLPETHDIHFEALLQKGARLPVKQGVKVLIVDETSPSRFLSTIVFAAQVKEVE
jgi:hypothetical protein